jgi:hypothetical protein
VTFSRTKRAPTAGSITWVVVPAFAVPWRTRRVRTDQRSSAGFPSRAFTAGCARRFARLDEEKANMLPCRLPLDRHVHTGESGIRRRVDVTAESVDDGGLSAGLRV